MDKPKKSLPEWLKVKIPGGENYLRIQKMLRSSNLHTVCEEARCPNIGGCWDRGTATFMILGDICTRSCRYCAVTTGRPVGLDIGEPFRLANTVKSMRLKYCVITSVNRDDLADGGAFIFSQCIKRIRDLVPDCKVEVLIPDFQGSQVGINTVIEARPDVINHNIESTKRIFRKVRPKGDYRRSLQLLAHVKQVNPEIPTKSGIIVGMGEVWDEIIETMRDLREVDCDLLTIGQYLRPSKKHLPISRFVEPREFEILKDIGMDLGFKHVASGPLVRSSYHADEQLLATQSMINIS